jgi:small subunit ribosomal protein S7
MYINKKKRLILNYLKILLWEGKQEKAENVLKLSFALIKQLQSKNPLIVLLDCVKKAQPFCEVKSLKIKGNVHRVPVEIKHERQKSLVFRWLLTNASTRSEHTFVESLSKEIIETTNLQSKTIKTCDEMHKIAEVNKIFTQLKN